MIELDEAGVAAIRAGLAGQLASGPQGPTRLQGVTADDGALVIRWALVPQRTAEDLLASAEADAVIILKAVQESSVSAGRVELNATFEIEDIHGILSRRSVVKASYLGRSLSSLDFTSFEQERVFSKRLAADVYMQEQLRAVAASR